DAQLDSRRVDLVIDDCCRGALGKDLGHEIVTVVGGSSQGEEAIAWVQGAGVNAPAGDSGFGLWNCGPDDFGDTVQGQGHGKRPCGARASALPRMGLRPTN